MLKEIGRIINPLMGYCIPPQPPSPEYGGLRASAKWSLRLPFVSLLCLLFSEHVFPNILGSPCPIFWTSFHFSLKFLSLLWPLARHVSDRHASSNTRLFPSPLQAAALLLPCMTIFFQTLIKLCSCFCESPFLGSFINEIRPWKGPRM